MMPSKIFEDKTTKMPGPDEWPVRVHLTRDEVDHMMQEVTGLPGQRKVLGISVEHAARPRKGRDY